MLDKIKQLISLHALWQVLKCRAGPADLDLRVKMARGKDPSDIE